MCFFRNKDVKMFESKSRPGLGKVRTAELFSQPAWKIFQLIHHVFHVKI